MLILFATRQNQQSGMCAQRRLSSAWASAQPDVSALSAHTILLVCRVAAHIY